MYKANIVRVHSLLPADLQDECQGVACVAWKLPNDRATKMKAGTCRQTGTVNTDWWMDVFILISLWFNSIQWLLCWKGAGIRSIAKAEGDKMSSIHRSNSKLKQIMSPQFIQHSIFLSISLRVQYLHFAGELHTSFWNNINKEFCQNWRFLDYVSENKSCVSVYLCPLCCLSSAFLSLSFLLLFSTPHLCLSPFHSTTSFYNF